MLNRRQCIKFYETCTELAEVKRKGERSSTGCASATMQNIPLWRVEGHCHHLSVFQVLLRSKSTENPPSHIRRRASCARGEMHPAFLGVMAGRIFLWVQGDREVALAVPVLRYKKPRCGG